jgi:hypothetical protein
MKKDKMGEDMANKLRKEECIQGFWCGNLCVTAFYEFIWLKERNQWLALVTKSSGNINEMLTFGN